jgi:hypothetical protein
VMLIEEIAIAIKNSIFISAPSLEVKAH